MWNKNSLAYIKRLCRRRKPPGSRITAEGNNIHHWMEEGTQPEPEPEE
uniref:Uncharacterized protein n=1 Tax=Aegilops tauschii subsp. strangulata TaxID=200361 RepID=A0A453MBJ5_AEGTS